MVRIMLVQAHPNNRIEPTMNAMRKTARRIFNALAFANVSNLGEFHTLLRQLDDPETAAHEPTQPGTMAQPSGNTPLMEYIRGAV
jgi:hypothetical protein